jgi:hypothetical protein
MATNIPVKVYVLEGVLPNPLEPDAIYYVRINRGTGLVPVYHMEQYITSATGEAISAVNLDTVDNLIADAIAGLSNSDTQVYGERPAGTINGANASFTALTPFIPETVRVTVAGVRLKVLDDYNTSGNSTINLNFSPETGTNIIIDYAKQQ